MNYEETRYYLILGRRLGKKDGGKYFILRGGAWEEDNNNEIMDRLMGYDPSEPPGSPYGIGNTSIMDEIEEISYEQASVLSGGVL